MQLSLDSGVGGWGVGRHCERQAQFVALSLGLGLRVATARPFLCRHLPSPLGDRPLCSSRRPACPRRSQSSLPSAAAPRSSQDRMKWRSPGVPPAAALAGAAGLILRENCLGQDTLQCID